MSYVKLPKTVSDHAIGLQSVNQALDNNTAIFEQYDAKHGVGFGNTIYGEPFIGAGRHDDTLVARSVADFFWVNSNLYALLGGPAILDSPIRDDVGKWRIYVTTPHIIGVVATIREATAADYYAQCRTVTDASGQYVVVTTWDIAGAALVDVAFSLSIWSKGVA